ncbi:hypothetical protein [Paraclostridium bifermentans]
MNIPHCHMNHFLVSSFKSYGSVLKLKPLITFVEYLKSQIQYDIVSLLYGRDILEYNNAYNYLNGTDKSDRAFEDYKKVIRYFYLDVSNMILKSSEDFEDDFSIIGNNEIPKTEGIKRVAINIESVAKDLDAILSGVGEIVNEYDLDYMIMLDGLTVNQLRMFKAKQLFTEVMLLQYFGNQEELVYMEVIENE